MLIQRKNVILLQVVFASLSEVTSFVISPQRAIVHPSRSGATATTGRSFVSLLASDSRNNENEDHELFYYIAQGGSRNNKNTSPSKPGEADELSFYGSLSPASSTKSGRLPIAKGALAPQDISSLGSGHTHPIRVNAAPSNKATANVTSSNNTAAVEPPVQPSTKSSSNNTVEAEPPVQPSTKSSSDNTVDAEPSVQPSKKGSGEKIRSEGSLPNLKGTLAPQDISSLGSAHTQPTRVNAAPRSNATALSASSNILVAAEPPVQPPTKSSGGNTRSGESLPNLKGTLAPQDISSLGSAHTQPTRVNSNAAPRNNGTALAASSSNPVAGEPPEQPLKRSNFISFLPSESDPERYSYTPTSKTSEGGKQVPKNSGGRKQYQPRAFESKYVSPHSYLFQVNAADPYSANSPKGPYHGRAFESDNVDSTRGPNQGGAFESNYVSPYSYPFRVGNNAVNQYSANSARGPYQGRAFESNYVSPYSYPFQVGNDAAPYSAGRNYQPPTAEHPYRSEYLPMLSDVAGSASVVGPASTDKKPVPVDSRLWPDTSEKPAAKKPPPGTTAAEAARASQLEKTKKPPPGTTAAAARASQLKKTKEPSSVSDAVAAVAGGVSSKEKIEKPSTESAVASAAGGVSAEKKTKNPSADGDVAAAAGGLSSEKKTEVPKKKRIGILLMDHGSRNQASNDRLHELARIYQNTMGKDTDKEQSMIVTAAHMEIASPSIPDGLKVLLDADVDAIICHPYFLSADGRHVSEDIPEIMEAAKEKLAIDIPLVITEPIGSQTDVIVLAMHSLVMKGVLTL